MNENIRNFDNKEKKGLNFWKLTKLEINIFFLYINMINFIICIVTIDNNICYIENLVLVVLRKISHFI
jgi:hypothetical protein